MSLADVEKQWRALLLAKDEALMEGVDAARQRVYRRLVRNNLSGTIRRAVPVLRRLAGAEAVEALIAQFLDEQPVQTRLVRYIPLEFGTWLMERAAADGLALPHASAGELAHWESLEVDVLLAPDAEPRTMSLSPSDDARIETHPSARLAAYRHPVHTLTTTSTHWPAPSSSPVILLAWRSAERLTWHALEGGTAKVLVETSSGATIGEAFARIEASLVEGDRLDRARVRASLVDLCRRGALAGFAR